ncbi:MAG: hypothetical protein KTR14_05340 [Vampirovibrio sp.]|nr:hypothetical protein [Vampirovibrio sp.]
MAGVQKFLLKYPVYTATYAVTFSFSILWLFTLAYSLFDSTAIEIPLAPGYKIPSWLIALACWLIYIIFWWHSLRLNNFQSLYRLSILTFAFVLILFVFMAVWPDFLSLLKLTVLLPFLGCALFVSLSLSALMLLGLDTLYVMMSIRSKTLFCTLATIYGAISGLLFFLAMTGLTALMAVIISGFFIEGLD